jgi:hypothetical protein
MMSDKPRFLMPSRRGRMFAVLLVELNRINLTDFARHAKISNFADAHFIDQHILQFDVPMDVAHVMKVLKASYDLPEHGAYVIVWKGGATVTLEDVKQGTGWAVLGDEVIGVGSVIGFEERKDMFVMK